MSEEIKPENGNGKEGAGETTQIKVKPVMNIAVSEDNKVLFQTANKLTTANKDFFLNVLIDVMKSVISVKEEEKNIVPVNFNMGGVAGFRKLFNKRQR